MAWFLSFSIHLRSSVSYRTSQNLASILLKGCQWLLPILLAYPPRELSSHEVTDGCKSLYLGFRNELSKHEVEAYLFPVYAGSFVPSGSVLIHNLGNVKDHLSTVSISIIIESLGDHTGGTKKPPNMESMSIIFAFRVQTTLRW